MVASASALCKLKPPETKVKIFQTNVGSSSRREWYLPVVSKNKNYIEICNQLFRRVFFSVKIHDWFTWLSLLNAGWSWHDGGPHLLIPGLPGRLAGQLLLAPGHGRLAGQGGRQAGEDLCRVWIIHNNFFAQNNPSISVLASIDIKMWLKVHKHEIFFLTFFAETETIWSQGPVTRDF